MSNKEIEVILTKILKDIGIDTKQIKPNSYIHKDLQLDSLEIVQIALSIKRDLGIRIKMETRQDKTLAEICYLIESEMSMNTGTGIN